jgi:hypothetical protein
MNTAKTSKNNPPPTTESLANARDLYSALRILVDKIHSEKMKGTPLYPLRHPDCAWGDDYPRELVAARDLLKQLKRNYGR